MRTYLPVKRERLQGVTPWGYSVDPNDPYLLLPEGEILKWLDEGYKLLNDGAPFSKVCKWIEVKSGKSITAPTLTKLYNNDIHNEEGRLNRKKLVGYKDDNRLDRKWKHLTPEERAMVGLNRTKRKMTRQEKKLKKLKEAQAQHAELEALASGAKMGRPLGSKNKTPLEIPAEALPITEQVRIVPNAGPQTEFLAAPEFEVLYGGAAGGGKSWALTVDQLRTVHLPSHKAIMFRKTNDDLRTLIGMSKEIFPKLIPNAKFNEQKSTWYFPGGGWLWYRYLDKDIDVESMQGQDFTWAGFDEVGQWASSYVYEYVRSRIRTSDPVIRPYLSIRASANPGGVGMWVKKMFIDPAPPNTAFPATSLETGLPMLYPDDYHDVAKRGKPLFYRRFIPAKLSDNPYLFTDGSYEAGLLSLPEAQRKQLLEGNWDIVEGAAFSEFDRNIHVCQPFDIPRHWTKFRMCDWGYTQPACCLWGALDNNNHLYIYRELYTKKVLAPDFADKILELEREESVTYGVLDDSAWDNRGGGGTTVAEAMIKRGCFWRKAGSKHKGTRVFRKQELHRRLQVKELPDEITGQIKLKAAITIFSTCVNTIRTVPTLPLDKNNPEDVDTDCEDHAYDALTYGCMSRSMTRNQRPFSQHHIEHAPARQYNAFGFPTG